MLFLYLAQVFLGRYIHARRGLPKKYLHPPSNILHAGFGILLIVLAFFQVGYVRFPSTVLNLTLRCVGSEWPVQMGELTRTICCSALVSYTVECMGSGALPLSCFDLAFTF